MLSDVPAAPPGGILCNIAGASGVCWEPATDLMSPPPLHPLPEALLTHQDFVRALVRSLLRGAEGEDDVVQDTWLRALANPPRDAARGRQWLARVAQNMVRDHQRGRRRRSIHERRAESAG